MSRVSKFHLVGLGETCLQNKDKFSRRTREFLVDVPSM